MIDEKLYGIITGIYKTQNLQHEFDTNKDKLTANNFNTVLSSIIELHQYDSLVEQNISDIYKHIEKKDEQLYNLIMAISARLTSLDSEDAITAVFAQHAGYIDNKLNFITNDRNISQYNGLTEKTISGILSSYYSVQSISAFNSLSAINSNNSNFALSAQNSNNAILAQNALTANIAELAKKINNPLIWINGLEYQAQYYDGTSPGIISSVLHSISAQYSDYANVAFSAEYDYYGNQLNTKILHKYNSENKDYPLLFSDTDFENIEDYERYPVGFNPQILINPYLGAIKANYFIGNAISSTYAISDKDNILLNTRVCQNQTSNNYDYPILLAFIAKNESNTKIQACDGDNNEVLYTSEMRINPYINIIHNANTDVFTSDLTLNDKSLNCDADITKYIALSTQYFVNYEGLATRAVCDSTGYEIGRKAWLTPDNDNNPNERPLLFALETNRTTSAATRDEIGFCSGIFVNTLQGNITGNKFIGVATSAQWADLAEKYETDMEYPIGTLICFGGQKEITIATNEVNGVISHQPAYLMNSKCQGQPIALVGRVPVLIKGKVNKFDYITLSNQPGIGISTGKLKPDNLIGRALKSKDNEDIELLECTIQLSL